MQRSALVGIPDPELHEQHSVHGAVLVVLQCCAAPSSALYVLLASVTPTCVLEHVTSSHCLRRETSEPSTSATHVVARVTTPCIG
jgi:hypothetical protein